MLCSLKRMIYPKNPNANSSGYMVGIYNVHEKLLDANGNNVTEVKIVGYFLPAIENVRVNITGHWAKNDKHGTQFEMESYLEDIEQSRKGIVTYLASGFVKGIGPKTAEKIYEKFGDQTLEVLDKNPEKLKSIPGISSNKLKRICDSYLASRGARDAVTFLAPYGVTPNMAVKIYREFGTDTMRILRENPYRLCDMAGIGFITADKIAINIGLDPKSGFRIDAGILHTLKDSEARGNLCMEKEHFIKQCVKLLNTEGIDFKAAGERAYIMLKNNRLALYEDQVYRIPSVEAEISVADSVGELLSYGPVKYPTDLETEINLEERRMGLKLAFEQRQAIKSCLTSRISIVSGGPGTGKTLIQRAMLNIFMKLNKSATVTCCAPTGRAARRMEQCTGFPASTIHKTLGLMVSEFSPRKTRGENGAEIRTRTTRESQNAPPLFAGFSGDDIKFNEPEPIDADFILVDEVSMLDIYLAQHLFNSVKRGAQLVLVGDADQLPSVGPGAVLSELIACGCVPVVKLDKVFRQNAGSRIATNAKLIRHNNLSLEYGDDFQFIESQSYEESADIIIQLFQDEVSRVGLDNVALLTPFRSKTETGANALNDRLREKINQPSPEKPDAVRGKRVFRLGDKVMQVKNHDDVSNGDVGYITAITGQGRDCCVTVDFGDGRVSEYEDSDLDLLELAYAGTVHKSQGSEYASVIINIQNGHYVMLKRPLIYTAITRAKQRVIIVGERRALCMAINTVDTEKRGTRLATRIRNLYSAAAANLLEGELS